MSPADFLWPSRSPVSRAVRDRYELGRILQSLGPDGDRFGDTTG
jgi:hypothetical protein